MGESLLVNPNPVSDAPGASSVPLSMNSMLCPSVAPPPFKIADQLAGLTRLVGVVGRKSSPGTQANQNEPIFVVPVL